MAEDVKDARGAGAGDTQRTAGEAIPRPYRSVRIQGCVYAALRMRATATAAIPSPIKVMDAGSGTGVPGS